MHALIANKVMCAEPAPRNEQGERVELGCCQPGTEIVTLGGVDLEFCLRHAVKYWEAEIEQASG